MASRSISDLNEETRNKYLQFAVKMTEAGIPFTITCTARTYSEQVALFAQGRKTLEEVNALRKQVGLWLITAEENRRKVTWTLNSKHIIHNPGEKARAFDIVILKGGKAEWSLKVDVNENEIPDYEEAAEIGRSVGLKPGADFGDYPHFET